VHTGGGSGKGNIANIFVSRIAQAAMGKEFESFAANVVLCDKAPSPGAKRLVPAQHLRRR
jgi:hypothetical protein